MADSEQSKTASRAWMRAELRNGSRGARLALGCGVAGVILAVAQAFCSASVLTEALSATARIAVWPLLAFAALVLARAGLGYAAEVAAAEAGAGARRRLRTDTLNRLLHAGPAMLLARHSGDLATIVVDRIEALDGLYSRWVTAAVLAVAGPLIVLVAVAVVDPIAALVLAGCGLLVPVGMAAAGLGAATAARGQFIAMARLQARFLDRMRGIATIVSLGRADDEAEALSQARADSVVKYLVAKGIAPERLVGKGFGETKPLCKNAAELATKGKKGKPQLDACREQNRRVQFKLLEMNGKPVPEDEDPQQIDATKPAAAAPAPAAPAPAAPAPAAPAPAAPAPAAPAPAAPAPAAPAAEKGK